jgi:hypothetical protein
MGQEKRELSSLETTCLPQTQMIANAVRSRKHSTEEWSHCLFTIKAQKSNLLSLSTQTINKNKKGKKYQMRSRGTPESTRKGEDGHLRRKY